MPVGGKIIVGLLRRWPLRTAVVLGLAFLAACAGPTRRPLPSSAPSPPGDVLQCVPYVRAHSAVKLKGDAVTWWDQANGRYARRTTPTEGSVMVLVNYAGPNRAHVAVVRRIVGRHEIRVDHANWFNDGKIYVDDPVRDASADGDWSAVNVYNLRSGQWGLRTYPVRGFIGPDDAEDEEPLVSLIWDPRLAVRFKASARLAMVDPTP